MQSIRDSCPCNLCPRYIPLFCRQEDLATFQFSRDPNKTNPNWKVQVGMAQTDKSYNGKSIFMAWEGEPGKESSQLQVIIFGSNKYFHMNYDSGTFEMVRNSGRMDKEILSQVHLSELTDNPHTFNYDIESAQQGDPVVFHHFEYDRQKGNLGFQVAGFPSLENNQAIVIPARIKVNLK